MKKLLSIILFTLVFTALGFCLCYHWHSWDSNQRYVQGWKDGYTYLKPIEDLQRQVGCVKIDGKFGPCWRESETQEKYELALNSQYAEQSMCSNVREFDRKMLAEARK